MRFGLFGLHWGFAPADIARLAREAEGAGFDSLWIGDHIALPASEADPLSGAAYRPRLEVVSMLSYLAAVTHRVQLAAGVIVLPQRHPVVLAKQLATVDVLSAGRLTVGIGVGYIHDELAALGVNPAHRGAQADEYLAAMRALWAEPVARFEGEWVSFADVVQRPLPVQRPGPRIVVGGESKAAYRRAVGSADGWYGWNLDLERAAAAVSGLEEAALEAGLAGAERIELNVTPLESVPDVQTAERYAELGVDRLVLKPASEDPGAMSDVITAAHKMIDRLA